MAIAPDDDLGGVDMGGRFFGPDPLTEEMTDPSLVGDDEFERILAGNEDTPFHRPLEAALSANDRARAALIVKMLMQLFRNTAFTAADPAHVAPTVFSDPLDLSGVATVPAGIGATWTDLVSFTIPVSRWARVDGYGINVRTGGFTYDGDIVFRIIVDGNPVPTLESFGEQRGTPVLPRKTVIILRQDQTIALQARRTAAGGPDDVEGVLTGWTWRLRNTYEGTQGAVTAY